jgi:hypothetical protein
VMLLRFAMRELMLRLLRDGADASDRGAFLCVRMAETHDYSEVFSDPLCSRAALAARMPPPWNRDGRAEPARWKGDSSCHKPLAGNGQGSTQLTQATRVAFEDFIRTPHPAQGSDGAFCASCERNINGHPRCWSIANIRKRGVPCAVHPHPSRAVLEMRRMLELRDARACAIP